MAGHYLKEWRRHRQLKQEEVIVRLSELGDSMISLTSASLSRLENSKQPYSERILTALAEIYETRPGHLLERNPEIEAQLVDLVAELTEVQKLQVIALIKEMKKSAHKGPV